MGQPCLQFLDFGVLLFQHPLCDKQCNTGSVLCVTNSATLKNAAFWDVAPFGFIISRRFVGTCRFHLQGRRNNMSEEKCWTVANRLNTVWSAPPSCLAVGLTPPHDPHLPSRGSHAPSCIQSVSKRLTVFLAQVISSTLKMEATHSSETSVYNKHTRRHIAEDGILRSHRLERLKSYIVQPWVSKKCLVSTYWRRAVLQWFTGMYCFHLQASWIREESSKQTRLLAGCFVGLFFSPEDGDSTAFWNVCELLVAYRPSHKINTVHNRCHQNLKSNDTSILLAP
jgi:hypothetical protein